MFLTQDKNDQKPNKPTTASLYDITPAQTKFMTKPVTSDRVVFPLENSHSGYHYANEKLCMWEWGKTCFERNKDDSGSKHAMFPALVH